MSERRVCEEAECSTCGDEVFYIAAHYRDPEGHQWAHARTGSPYCDDDEGIEAVVPS